MFCRGTSASVEAGDDGFGFLFGLGAEYRFSEQIGLRVEWERYHDVGDDDAGTDADVNTFGGSVLFRF